MTTILLNSQFNIIYNYTPTTPTINNNYTFNNIHIKCKTNDHLYQLTQEHSKSTIHINIVKQLTNNGSRPNMKHDSTNKRTSYM